MVVMIKWGGSDNGHSEHPHNMYKTQGFTLTPTKEISRHP